MVMHKSERNIGILIEEEFLNVIAPMANAENDKMRVSLYTKAIQTFLNLKLSHFLATDESVFCVSGSR